MTPTELGDLTADISHGDMSVWLDAKVTRGQTRGYLQFRCMKRLNGISPVQ